MRFNKNLSILLSGQLVSQIGDKFYLLALSYWVLESTGSAALMGTVMFFSLFPETLAGFAAGAVADRYNKKWIIVLADLFRGLVVLALALLYYFEAITIWRIIIAQFLLSLSSAFFNPCIPAVIPQIVKRDDLSKANAQTQLIRGIATVLGPVLGGVSVAVFGYLFVFVCNGLSFLISAFFELFLSIPSEKTSERTTRLMEDIKEGLNFISRQRALVLLLGTIVVVHFFVGSFQVITPILSNLLAGNGIENLGYLQTSFGVGMIVFSFAMGVIILMKEKEGKMLLGAIFLIGMINLVIAILSYSGVKPVWFYFVPFFCYGGTVIVAVTAFRTLVQKLIPLQMAGRVFGVAFSVSDASIPLAILIYGLLLDRVSVHLLLAISGTSLMIITLLLVIRTGTVSAFTANESTF